MFGYCVQLLAFADVLYSVWKDINGDFLEYFDKFFANLLTDFD